MSEIHRCDDRCVCPIHDTPLFYWPAGDDHACQDPGCEQPEYRFVWSAGSSGRQYSIVDEARDAENWLRYSRGHPVGRVIIDDQVNDAPNDAT